MSEHSYSCEFASGARAKLTLNLTAARIDWTPDVPRSLKGQARRRFLAAYRTWRDECIADFARRSGISITVLEL